MVGKAPQGGHTLFVVGEGAAGETRPLGLKGDTHSSLAERKDRDTQRAETRNEQHAVARMHLHGGRRHSVSFHLGHAQLPPATVAYGADSRRYDSTRPR